MGGIIPNQEYMDKIKSIDRKFIEADPFYAQFVAKEYFHYIFDKYGTEHQLVIGDYKVRITKDNG